MQVQEIMTTDMAVTQPHQKMSKICDVFSEVDYHHIPVVDESKLVGIVSDRDVTRCMSPMLKMADDRLKDEALLKKIVSDVMTTSVVTADKTTTIECASILLLENKISCLPVVDESNSLEGILTWKDILRFHVYLGSDESNPISSD